MKLSESFDNSAKRQSLSCCFGLLCGSVFNPKIKGSTDVCTVCVGKLKWGNFPVRKKNKTFVNGDVGLFFLHTVSIQGPISSS